MSQTTHLKLNKHDNPSTNENEFDVENYLNVNWDKIDEDSKNKDTNITELQLENEKLQERVELQEKNMLSGKETGETVNLPESADYFCKVKVQGNSKQETREGYNLFSYDDLEGRTTNGITFTVNEDKSVTANGTATANATLNLMGAGNVYPLELEAGDYILSGCEGGSNSTYYIEIYDGKTYRANQFGNTNINFAEDTAIRAYISVRQGITVNNVIFYPMLIRGTEAKPYEPHGAMPSIEYPSEIENVTDDIDITVCNKNLCYKTELQNTSNIRFYFDTKSILKTVTISFIVNVALDANSIYCRADGIDVGGIIINVTSDANTKAKATIEFTDEEYEKIKNASQAYFLLYKNNAGFELPNEAMIENSSTQTEYIKNENQTVKFTLEEGQRLHNKDYLADNGIHHKRKTVVLNGTEAWALSTQNEYQWFRYNLAGTKKGTDFICTHLKNYANIGNYIGISNNNTEDRVYIAISEEITTVEQLKTWLASNNLTVEYELAQEEIEEYTEEQKVAYNKIEELKTYKGASNAYTNTIAILDVEYKKDLETVISNLQATILASEEV